MGTLNAFAERNPDVGMIAVTFDPAEKAREFVAKHDFHWPVLPDARPFVDAVGVRGYPSFALVDRQGRLIDIRLGLRFDGPADASPLVRLQEWVDRMRGETATR